MRYEEPKMEIVLFSVNDVVTASATQPGLNETENNKGDRSGWGDFSSFGDGWV